MKPARCRCRLQLVSRFNASFLHVSIQIMCKRKNMHARGQTQAHRLTLQFFSLNLTCVFIKVSRCSIVLRSNGDWLWRNYTNLCMNLVLMEAEHLTQTKCRGADQCWGAFFLFLVFNHPLIWTAASSPKTGHLHLQCISFKIITKQEPGDPSGGDSLQRFRNDDALSSCVSFIYFISLFQSWLCLLVFCRFYSSLCFIFSFSFLSLLYMFCVVLFPFYILKQFIICIFFLVLHPGYVLCITWIRTSSENRTQKK